MKELEDQIKILNEALKMYACDMEASFVFNKNAVNVYVSVGNRPIEFIMAENMEDILKKMPEFKEKALSLCVESVRNQ